MKSTLYRSAIAGFLTLSFLVTATFALAEPGYAQSGAEWSEPVNISNSGASSDPSIVVDSNGTIHVIWVDAVDGYKYSKSKDGANWSDPVTVEFPFNRIEDSRPRLIADSSGSIHIFWTREVILGEGTDQETRNNNLMYARTGADFLSQPLSWAAVEKLADSVLDFDAYADARNSLHLSFVGSQAIGTAPAGIFYRRLDSGSTWAPPVSLYSSQYFRTLQLDDTHVRLAAAGGGGTANIYVVWDDRSVKRIFLGRSTDGGKNWEDSVELRGPEDATGLSLPYNANVSVTGKNVLLTWQMGQPGSVCSLYSQWSVDGGGTFSEAVRVSDELNLCPSSSAFVGRNPGYFMMMLDSFGDLSLVAWNGDDWSSLQPQSEITTFQNDITLDSVILAARQVTSYEDRFLVVGRDEVGGDIWFRYRRLGTLIDWFPLPSAWTGPVSVSRINQEISSGAAVADTINGFHAFWMQNGKDVNENTVSTLQYIKWENGRWSNPINLINGIAGIPHFLTASSDQQGGVLLAWVEGINGDIYFSRASGDKAYLAAEWLPPVLIPSLSELNTTPDMITDSSNRIVLVYSIPFNENRGIYLVQSENFGRNWSEPVRVFDAVLENWDSVVQPRIDLSADGRLHLLFTRIALRESGQEASLYYSQSQDGGTTWTTPEIISNGSVQWSEIVHSGGSVVYRLWQERNGDVFEAFSEESRDAGLSWSGPLKLSSIAGNTVDVSLTKDADGHLYLAQSQAVNEGLVVDEIFWDGTRWNVAEMKPLTLGENLDRDFIHSGIAHDKTLHFLVLADYAGSDQTAENEIVDYNRLLDVKNNLQNQPDVILSTIVPSLVIVTPEPGLTPTRSPMQFIEDAPNSRLRNNIGFALIAGIVILTLLIVRPRKK